ncbi:MAG TPA: hypothetical protein VFW38_00265 [Solirubrobacteraceae bacterium]|nr:hypothetical protein [Solirubrobacteraceae bacterium]
MTLRTRFWLLGMLVCAVAFASVGIGASAAFGAFGVESFVAANCKTGHETCVETAIGPTGEYSFPKEPSLTEAEEGGYTQAAGHPAVGVTAFKINTTGTFPNEVPTGVVTHVRTDVAPGVSTSPEAVGKCKMAEFEHAEAAPGFFLAPECNADTEIGENKVVVAVEAPSPAPPGTIVDVALKGKVYNLVQPNGLSSLFGVALDLTNVGHPGVFAHTLIEGHVEWASDYHDYYEINVSPTIPLIASRLELKGDIGTTGNGGFITNPSNCAGPGAATRNTVSLQSNAGPATRTYEAPIGTEGCNEEKELKVPPFEPGFKLTTETQQSDQPTGVTTEATLAHDPSPMALDNSQLKTATVTLPEGMTLSPSAAKELTACSLSQLGIGTRNATTCPAGSQIGTATLTVPQLPADEPLQGNVYLGGGPTVTGPPYEMYVNAESARYGVTVRLRGIVKPDPSTGQLTTEFTAAANNEIELPEQPFTNLTLNLKGKDGSTAPLANPLECGPATTNSSFAPYTGASSVPLATAFTVTGEKGAACPAPLPFALSQSTENVPTGGGQASNFTLHLKRSDGQQYLSNVSSDLPLGLVGKIPAVPLCPEPAANNGNCPASSQIGKVATVVGSGPSAVSFGGNVYLTGPTNGAPYGMTIVVNAAIGPFSLGNVVTRAAIEVNQFTGRVTVTGKVPTIWAGIPLRLKELVIAINRQGFLINPTNCGSLATQSRLGGQQGGTQTVSTPYRATGCSSLGFKPKFAASTSGKSSRANGTSLITKLNFHPKGVEANVKSVVVSLPKALPSRTSTLNHACREVVFNANPFNCPSGARIGSARVKTQVLPGQLSGPVYYVSHGGAKFPDVDAVLLGDGVRIILVGNTNINEKTNVTTTSFLSNPDVPFTGFELNLPLGPKSAVGANGNLCRQSLVMPTTITAQNGKVIKMNTPVGTTGCPVTVLSRFTRGNKAIVTVKAPAAGRVSGSGAHLGTRYKHPNKAKKVTLVIPLSKAVGHRSIRVRIGFLPKNKKERSSVAHTTVVF